MNNAGVVEVFDSEDFNDQVADRIIAAIKDCLNQQEVCRIALAGGSTPGKIYQLITSSSSSSEIDWSAVRFFLGDERFTSDIEQRNATLVEKTLLQSDLIPASSFIPINQNADTAEIAAAEYQQAIVQEFSSVDQDNIPRFDLILLGMGSDGHTASLFPGENILKNFNQLIATAQAPVDPKNRVSMTYPLLINARKIFFLISGESKAKVVEQVVNQPDQAGYPICFYPVAKADVYFLLDKSAASLLSN